VNNHEGWSNDSIFKENYVFNLFTDSVQRGLSSEDLLYPFDRQFWYQNYKDLLESRPIDPHSVTYQEKLYVLVFLPSISRAKLFIFLDLEPQIYNHFKAYR
jgi:hypothetical protein